MFFIMFLAPAEEFTDWYRYWNNSEYIAAVIPAAGAQGDFYLYFTDIFWDCGDEYRFLDCSRCAFLFE